jgi:CheY-like chemotaxis protein
MPKTLLLADDSIVIQKLVGLSFANEDVRIVATDNGDDAIARVRDVVPDVVLADVVMPGKNGYEVCEAIKQDARLAHIPVLLLTGTFEVFDEARATRAGADGQITKPFEARALVERVSEYMNRPPVTSGTDSPNDDAATVAIDEDLFDPNVTTLSPLDASPDPESRSAPGQRDRATGLSGPHSESTPAYSGDTSSSLLFGAPGEGANEDDLEPEIGELVLGQTVSNVEAARDEAARPAGERPLDETPALDPASTSASKSAVTSATDDFRAFEDDLGLDEPLEFSDSLSVSPEDLDDELGSGDDDATWLGGLEQPRDADPFSMSDVADRSREVSDQTRGPDRAATPTGPPMPARDASTGVPAGLDLGPASVASDDLEFGFDVSEQVSADRLEDPFEDALVSPTADRAEDGMAPPASAARSSDTIAPPQRSAASWDTEDILVGYDVSTSDLAGDPGAPAGAGVEVSEPIPASAAFVPATSLPPQRTQSEGAASPTPSSVSPAPDPTSVPPAAPGSDASADTGREAKGIDSDDESESLDLEANPRTGLPAAEHADESLVAEPRWLDSEAQSEPIDLDDDQEPSQAPTGIEDEPVQLIPDSAGPEDRRIADLSPMMEQRIQETLEKVAWEAFADLSESIVKQVLGRVEQIAWEVIPQMAETLVREEIRRMKGDDD